MPEDSQRTDEKLDQLIKLAEKNYEIVAQLVLIVARISGLMWTIVIVPVILLVLSILL